MHYVYQYLIQTIWIIWLIYWRISAGNVKQNAQIESTASRLSHHVPLWVGILLVAIPFGELSPLTDYFWPQTKFHYWLGVAILLGGFALGVWARRVLGRNWSNAVTVKQEHELIQGGPYARIRHPIYTALLLGFLGTALALSQWRGLLACVFIWVAFLIKLRVEERVMTQTFGERYAAYRQGTGMLLPKLV